MRATPQRLAAVAAVALLALPATLPLVSAAAAWAVPANEVWQHQLAHVLPRVAGNTALLLGWWRSRPPCSARDLRGSLRATISRDVACSRGRCCCRSRCPGYVLAVVFAGALDFAGPLQSWLRAAAAPRLAPAADPLAGRRGAGAVAVPVSVRVHARARRLRDRRSTHARGGADAGPRSAHGVPSCAAAAGATRGGSRRRPRVHGDARGLRRGGGTQRGYVHDGDLPRLVRHVLDRCRAADGGGAGGAGADRSLGRAATARRPWLRGPATERRAAAAAADPWPRGGRDGARSRGARHGFRAADGASCSRGPRGTRHRPRRPLLGVRRP